MADAMTIQFDGKSYSIDDFTLGELEWLEDEMGCALDEINAGSMKAALRFVCIIKRREDPEFTLDEARKLKLSIFDDSEPEKPKKRRPTAAATAA